MLCRDEVGRVIEMKLAALRRFKSTLTFGHVEPTVVCKSGENTRKPQCWRRDRALLGGDAGHASFACG